MQLYTNGRCSPVFKGALEEAGNKPVLVQEVLTDSLSMEWTPEQAAVLRQTEGIESVVQAVARVHDANQVDILPNAYMGSTQLLPY